MARLIDGDALLVKMKHRREYIGRPSDPVCLVEDAPTIPAIPVEWLESQIVQFSDELKDGVKGVFNVTIREMIYRWQQEQEAQDG